MDVVVVVRSHRSSIENKAELGKREYEVFNVFIAACFMYDKSYDERFLWVPQQQPHLFICRRSRFTFVYVHLQQHKTQDKILNRHII